MNSETSGTGAKRNTRKRRDIPAGAVVVAIALSILTQLVTSGAFLLVSAEARQHNCERVRDAFEAYTQALADISGADEERVNAFRAAYEPQLKECR